MEEKYCEYNNIGAEMNASIYPADGVGEYIENGQREIDHEEIVVTMEKVKCSEQVLSEHEVIEAGYNRASPAQRKPKHSKEYDKICRKTHRGVKTHQCKECKNKFGKKIPPEETYGSCPPRREGSQMSSM